MKKASYIVCSVCILLLFGCKEDKWTSYVYPNKKNLFYYINYGEYDSLDVCLEESAKELQNINSKVGFYQCGLNCTNESGQNQAAFCKKLSSN